MKKKPYVPISEVRGTPAPVFVSAKFVLEYDRLEKENELLHKKLEQYQNKYGILENDKS